MALWEAGALAAFKAMSRLRAVSGIMPAARLPCFGLRMGDASKRDGTSGLISPYQGPGRPGLRGSLGAKATRLRRAEPRVAQLPAALGSLSLGLVLGSGGVA